MNRLRLLCNALSVALVLATNYFSQIGKINGQTIGSLSRKYDNLFTPAGFAFSIWGIIFLGMLLLVAYQAFCVIAKREQSSFSKVGFWFALVNLCNALWVVLWLYEMTAFSVLMMLLMLIGLTTICIRLRHVHFRSNWAQRAFVCWPLSVYAGWISVATIANISAYLSKLGWQGGIFTPATWTISLIVVAVLLYVFVSWKLSLSSFALVGCWALYAIYARHQVQEIQIAVAAAVGAIVILLSIVAFEAKKRFATAPIV